MKRLLTLCFLCIMLVQLRAQDAVGINTNSPHASAVLDVVSTERGVLIPRMTSTQRNNISNPGNGLLVYDTTTNTFWFYNSSSWIQIESSTSNDRIADADGDTQIQMEESTDEDIIRFDLGGTEYFRMDTGRLEVVNTGNTIMIGANAGQNDDYTDNQNVFIGANAGQQNTSGSQNVAVGFQSLRQNTTGTNNLGLGEGALQSNTTGSGNVALGGNALDASSTIDSNVAVGFNALSNLTSGSNNVAMGLSSMVSKTGGSSNVAIGSSSLQSNLTGDQNVALGRQAGQNSTGSGNVFLGFRAGRNETGDNKLYIESTASTTPLIWGDFSADSVVINGDEHVTGNITYVGTISDVSDRRLKTDFDTLNQVMDLVQKLQAYTYHMKDDQDKVREYGLIAQEVQKVFPEMVKVMDEEKGYLGVSYIQLVPVLLEALKEQQALINQQKLQLSSAQDNLEQLKAEVELIENIMDQGKSKE